MYLSVCTDSLHFEYIPIRMHFCGVCRKFFFFFHIGQFNVHTDLLLDSYLTVFFFFEVLGLDAHSNFEPCEDWFLAVFMIS